MSILTQEPLLSPRTRYSTSEGNLFCFFIPGVVLKSRAPSLAKKQEAFCYDIMCHPTLSFHKCHVSSPFLTEFLWHSCPLPQPNGGSVSQPLRPCCILHPLWQLPRWIPEDCSLTHLSPVCELCEGHLISSVPFQNLGGLACRGRPDLAFFFFFNN